MSCEDGGGATPGQMPLGREGLRDQAEWSGVTAVGATNASASSRRASAPGTLRHYLSRRLLAPFLVEEPISEDGSMSVEKRTAASIGRTSPLIVRTHTPVDRSYPVELAPRGPSGVTAFQGLGAQRGKMGHF